MAPSLGHALERLGYPSADGPGRREPVGSSRVAQVGAGGCRKEWVTILQDAPALPVALAAAALLLAALAAYAVARHRTRMVADGVRLDLSMPPAWALDLALAQFASQDWVAVAGDGSINRAHVRPGGPAVSVEAAPGEDGGSEVHLWMSGWTMRGGVVRHARVAATQMRCLAQVLAAADRSYDAPVRSDADLDVLSVLARREAAHVARHAA